MNEALRRYGERSLAALAIGLGAQAAAAQVAIAAPTAGSTPEAHVSRYNAKLHACLRALRTQPTDETAAQKQAAKSITSTIEHGKSVAFTDDSSTWAIPGAKTNQQTCQTTNDIVVNFGKKNEMFFSVGVDPGDLHLRHPHVYPVPSDAGLVLGDATFTGPKRAKMHYAYERGQAYLQGVVGVLVPGLNYQEPPHTEQQVFPIARVGAF